jgi:hypothetical protein
MDLQQSHETEVSISIKSCSRWRPILGNTAFDLGHRPHLFRPQLACYQKGPAKFAVRTNYIDAALTAFIVLRDLCPQNSVTISAESQRRYSSKSPASRMTLGAAEHKVLSPAA